MKRGKATYQDIISVPNIKDIFLLKTKVGTNDECWRWGLKPDRTGRGRLSIGKYDILATRLSYFIFKGNIKNDEVISRICQNQMCVNPGHLITKKRSEIAKIGGRAAAKVKTKIIEKGTKAYELTYTKDTGYNEDQRPMCECLCSCGKTIETRKDNFGRLHSCGCLYGKAKIERIKVGKKYGLLKIKAQIGTNWLCECECGNDITLPAEKIRDKVVRSCGCLGDKLKDMIESNKIDVEYERLFYENVVEKRRLLKKAHNITIEHFMEMIKEQDNCCAICHRSFYDTIINVDHCHITDIPRGLLDNQCNQALGCIFDSIAILTNMIAYLNRPPTNIKFNTGKRKQIREQLGNIQNCEICKCAFDDKGKQCIDHIHDDKTMLVRGIICSRCNVALGMFKDSIATINNAILYLSVF